MSAQYELAILGNPTRGIVDELERCLSAALLPFRLTLGVDVGWHVLPDDFNPRETTASAAMYFGPESKPKHNIQKILDRSIPVLPVVSSLKAVTAEIPSELRPINCIDISESGIDRVATALLECAGLLPKQRRVFISYKRDESRDIALQLFDALSARCFDVFLDTHGVSPGEDFQAMLWHRLCDSDVLLMLDTPNYFNSRWTSAEFGRALAKGIAVLRVGWPGFTASPRVRTGSRIDLVNADFGLTPSVLGEEAVDRICTQLETVRSQSFAVRNLNMVGSVRNALELIGGKVEGVGTARSIYVKLPDESQLVIYPTVGVPSAVTMHDAADRAGDFPVAVVYDHVGLHPNWQSHLDWLGKQIRAAKWIKVSEAGWALADWEAKS